MPCKPIRRALLAAALLCAGVTAAHAQVATPLNYSLAMSDGVLPNYHFDTGPQPCNIHSGLSETRYRTTTMTVSTAGTYSFTDAFLSGNDASLGIFTGAFNPASPTTNCFASVDDGASLALAPGNYTLVLTSLNGLSNIPGAFRYNIDGPAAVTFAETAPAAVPTLSEWAAWLLAALAGWLGLRSLRRGRTA